MRTVGYPAVLQFSSSVTIEQAHPIPFAIFEASRLPRPPTPKMSRGFLISIRVLLEKSSRSSTTPRRDGVLFILVKSYDKSYYIFAKAPFQFCQCPIFYRTILPQSSGTASDANEECFFIRTIIRSPRFGGSFLDAPPFLMKTGLYA